MRSREAHITAHDLAAVGITNQRETTVVWDRQTGGRSSAAIVWQDRRTAARSRELPRDLIRARTGLVPDPYFSATKLEWILQRCQRSQRDLAFGTVDSWLVWKLTGGDVHVVDVTNASRTLLFGLDDLGWDDELLSLFGVERELLPRIVPSSGVMGEAALFGASRSDRGHRRRPAGGALRTGRASRRRGQGDVRHRQLRARQRRERRCASRPRAFFERRRRLRRERRRSSRSRGRCSSPGAAVQWLRDGLGLISDAREAEELATQVDSTEGVIFVPALTGLGSPHWDPDARGLVSGLTRGTTRAHLVRATLEAIAFQVADVLDLYPGDMRVLRADGGASENRFLMQFQSDLLGCAVEVAAEAETTALGAAALAGLGIGTWPDVETLRPHIRRGARYEPAMDRADAALRRGEWRRGLERALTRAPA